MIRLKVSLQEKIKNYGDGNVAGLAVGYVQYTEDSFADFRTYLHSVDELMYEDKKKCKLLIGN